MNKLKSFVTFIACLATLTMSGQTLKTNTVYQIRNVGTSGRSMAIPSSRRLYRQRRGARECDHISIAETQLFLRRAPSLHVNALYVFC